jgi:hypothetical protein
VHAARLQSSLLGFSPARLVIDQDGLGLFLEGECDRGLLAGSSQTFLAERGNVLDLGWFLDFEPSRR